MRASSMIVVLSLVGALAWAEASPWESMMGSMRQEFGQPAGQGLRSNDAQQAGRSGNVSAKIASPSFHLPFDDPAELRKEEKDAFAVSPIGRYLSPSTQYGIRSEEIPVLQAGRIVLIQPRGVYPGAAVLSSQGSMAAVLHESGYVSVYSSSEQMLFDMD
ncbi:MAG: hypothetical protein LLF89_01795, partial [Spirochaetaceae bacterium]|nr:hypothetical protein [Spirochaetaceae bacterium]